MKKMVIFILILLVFLSILFYLKLDRINLEYNDNISTIKISTLNNRIIIHDPDTIKEVVKDLNKIKYNHSYKAKAATRESNVRILLLDKQGKSRQAIYYFGDVAICDNERYYILPFTYLKVDSICEKYKKKSE